ncbi:DUF4328 domain-containing protein [Lentzea alba]|uniref:DUF4328 domain-containing protein n=1 Tax=Lentzea alba TaxID=2714351 RepID=UPI0039BF08B7
MSRALIVLIGLTSVISVAEALLRWLIIYAGLYGVVTTLSSLCYLAAGITFIVWMFRARGVADTIVSTRQHRWSKPWTIAAWFVPIVNVWIPGVLVQDIWRASDRSQRLVPVTDRRKSVLVRAWWVSYTVSLLAGVLTEAVDDPETATALYSVSVVALALAGVLVVQVIRQIDEMQLSAPNACPAPAA